MMKLTILGGVAPVEIDLEAKQEPKKKSEPEPDIFDEFMRHVPQHDPRPRHSNYGQGHPFHRDGPTAHEPRSSNHRMDDHLSKRSLVTKMRAVSNAFGGVHRLDLNRAEFMYLLDLLIKDA